MKYNLAMDISAVMIFSLSLFYLHFKKAIHGTANRMFYILLLNGVFSAIVNIISCIVASFPFSVPRIILNGSNYLFYYLHNTTLFIYTLYILALTNSLHRLKENKLLSILICLPVVISITLISINPYTKWLFYYDSNWNYFRGSALYILYAVAIYYLFFAVIYLSLHKDSLEKEKRIAMYSIVPLCAGPVFLQLAVPSLQMEMLGISICLILILLTIQKPEENLDNLTGLWNRNLLMKKTASYFQVKRKFHLISIIITNLDVLNKSMGFATINGVLRDIARYLGQYAGKCCEIYYMDNGKYHLFLEHQEKDKIPFIAAKLKQRFQQIWKYKVMHLNLTSYICITDCPKDIDQNNLLWYYLEDLNDSIACQGDILYAKDCIIETLRRRNIERIIEKAIQNNSFQVYYQPIYSSSEKKVTTAEALIRLYDNEYGFIPPDEFIPITEQNGSIIKIGLMVFESVCKFIKSAHLEDLGIEYIEVNLSVVQCMQNNLAEQILSVIDQYQIDPKTINLEITETAAAYSMESLLQNIQKLRDRGIHFSMDDYGTGYSSMEHMTTLPLRLIKIDKSVICRKDENAKPWIALRGTIRMIRDLDFEIVAEGIESKEMALELIEQGCNYLQGYYFSKPIPSDEFLAFLLNENTKEFLKIQ